MNSDVLKHVVSFMDEATLKNLSRDPSIWEKITPVIDQYFWYLKAQRLVDIDLNWEKNSEENWHQIYNILSDISKKIDPFSHKGALHKEENGYNLLAVKTLLRLGYNLPEEAYDVLDDAVRFGTPEVVQLLLDDKSINPISNQWGNPLTTASAYGRIDMMKILLADPRTGGEKNISDAMIGAVADNELESIKFLIPLVNDKVLYDSLRKAAVDGHSDAFSLLLQHDRPYISRLGSLLVPVIRDNHLDIFKTILQDKRIVVSSENADSALSIAVQYNRPVMLSLLLADPLVAENTRGLNRALRIASENPRMNKIIELFLEHKELSFGEGILAAAVEQERVDNVELLLTDERTGSSKQVAALLKLDLLKTYNDKMIGVLLRGKNTDFGLLNTQLLNYIVSRIKEYISDVVEASSLLSGRNKDLILRDLSRVYDSFSKDHYELLLRELILKRLDLEYYLEWILKQLREDSTSTETRRLFSEAARSLSDGTSVHSSPLFTAYRGFMLLSVSSDAQMILNTLRYEEATQEGINLAGGLIGAFLGKKM